MLNTFQTYIVFCMKFLKNHNAAKVRMIVLLINLIILFPMHISLPLTPNLIGQIIQDIHEV